MAAAGRTITFTAVVHDADGRVSSALTARDIVIRDQAQQRPVTLFRNLRPSQALIAKRPPDQYTISNRPLAAFGSQQPVNVVVLDTRNTDPEFQPWMRSQALRFISMQRAESDIAFYQLAASGLRLVHEFSHDKPQLTSAVAGVLEPATAEEFERESSSSALRLERYRQTCEAISDMGEYLGRFEHRKNLLWISGDFPPLTQSENKRAEPASPACAAMALALNRSNTSLYPVDVRSPIAKEPFQPVAPGDLQSVPRNRRAVLSREWLDTMATLAAVTGGRAIQNRSQLAEAMTDALAETRFAYELGFEIPEAQCDAGLHAFRVQVNRRDATILAKQAFVADCGALQTDKPLPEPFDSPEIGLSVIPTSSGLKLLIAPSDLQSIEVTITERLAHGEIRTLTSQTFQPAFEKHEPAEVEIPLKPDAGAQTLRVIVRDKASQLQGSVTFPQAARHIA